MSDLRQKLQEMTTEELEAILREDFRKADRESSEDLVLCVLDILEQRAADSVPSAEGAYDSFRKNYLPVSRGCDSLYASRGSAGKKRIVRWAVGFAAAAAAVALTVGLALPTQNPNVPTEPPVVQQTQPRQFQLQTLSTNSVAITDENGHQAAVGTVELDRYSISASINVTGGDLEAYDYCAEITFTYIPVNGGPDQTATVQFVISTAEGAESADATAFSAGKISRICSAEVTFSAVAKGTNAAAVIKNPYVEFLAPI